MLLIHYNINENITIIFINYKYYNIYDMSLFMIYHYY